MHVFPREILHSRPFLAEVERQLPKLSDRPALLVWPTKDIAFREPERKRWEQLFPNHRTVILEGARPLHPGGRARRDRERDRILEPSGVTRRLIARLRALGHKVTLQPTAT